LLYKTVTQQQLTCCICGRNGRIFPCKLNMCGELTLCTFGDGPARSETFRSSVF